MSRVVRSLKPCESDLCDKRRNVHEPIFFLAIYLISIGTRGHKPSLESFGADQFDDENHYTIWYMCIASCNFFQKTRRDNEPEDHSQFQDSPQPQFMP
uniref:Peptide transporter n=1 Tax=Solanum tuberosum TaxID=4113 RepID=M1ARP8_SOLTU